MEDVKKSEWSYSKKIVFAFIASYLLFFVSGIIPDALVFWTGKYLLHIQDLKSYPDNGGGDTTFDYVVRVVQFGLSFILSLLIIVVGRKWINFEKWQYWLFVIIRYELAFLMIEYGFAKVFKTQFPLPNLLRLTQSYGESSPMGLLWAFMGYSKGYTMFIGASEMIAGFFLLFRKSTVIGAVLTFAIMLNVALLNLFYDVAVKLFAIELVLFSVVLLSPNLSQLYHFFLLGKETSLHAGFIPVFPKWAKYLRIIIKTGLISLILVYGVPHYYEEMQQSYDNAAKPPLFGVYKTKIFVINKDTVLPHSTTVNYWKELLIDKRKTIIKLANGENQVYTTKTDTINKSILFQLKNDTTKKHLLSYHKTKTDISIFGKWNQDSIQTRLDYFPVDSFLLINRGFHWINEFPLNK